MIDLMTREGYTRQSLRDIGEALGIVPALILYYFANREDPLQSLVELWDSDSIPALRETVARAALPSLELFVTAVGRNVGIPGMARLFLALAAEAVDPAHSAHAFLNRRVNRVQRDLGQGHDGKAGSLRSAGRSRSRAERAPPHGTGRRAPAPGPFAGSRRRYRGPARRDNGSRRLTWTSGVGAPLLRDVHKLARTVAAPQHATYAPAPSHRRPFHPGAGAQMGLRCRPRATNIGRKARAMPCSGICLPASLPFSPPPPGATTRG
ncbi:TetR/AcrR family transcriptional regulator [Novosphingobium sp. BW1]|nr:TetR/AcrR family transcriptional regulator [Novosphingobium sp. BW1]